MTSSDGAFGFLLPSQGVKYKMISIIEGRAKIIDMRKKSCICGDQGNFKDTVRISTPLGVTPDPILKALIPISYPEREKISDIGKNKAF